MDAYLTGLEQSLHAADIDKPRTAAPSQALLISILALSLNFPVPAMKRDHPTGAASCSSTAPLGVPARLSSSVRRQLARARRWGGYPLSISAAIPQHAAQSQLQITVLCLELGSRGEIAVRPKRIDVWLKQIYNSG